MKKTASLRSISLSKQLAFTAVFAALCCVSTLVITIRLPNGYFNTGDIFVLLSGWFLGPIYGTIAAGVGSMLADIISGYALYSPATLLIKSADALIACLLCTLLKKLIKKERLDFLPRLFSAVCGEGIMILGYFFYETLLYGWGGGAPALVGNALQGGCCVLCATILFSLLYPIKAVKQFFPILQDNSKRKQ